MRIIRVLFINGILSGVAIAGAILVLRMDPMLALPPVLEFWPGLC